MPTIASFLGEDHHRCDDLFVEAERLAARGEAPGSRAAHDAFTRAMEHHFSMEEAVIFPAFEERMGPSGPTAVMRHEHGQMRGLFELMGQSLGRGDPEAFLAASETLLIMMQQHNAKEEQILYPMIDRAFSDPAPLIERMGRIAEEHRVG